MLYTDWFKTNFENFAKEKEKFVPAFGVSYRIRDPQSIPEGNLPTTYDLSEDSDIDKFFQTTEKILFLQIV
jgi:hypothetical protein